ncbi:MAG: ABC transporter substrate-binding protein, partial [Sphaerochaetaceae bacterium]|nr:ABC transporter substrate-binding protein [Sphaerochaetaceae bacterium]
MKKASIIVLVLLGTAAMLFAQAAKEQAVSEGPVEFSMYYSDNATLPFKDSWLTVQETAKIANATVHYE